MPGVVAQAAKELDERVPGWEKMVDLGKLDMSSPCDCVLGQIAKHKRLRKSQGVDTPYARMIKWLGYDWTSNETLPRAALGSVPNTPWVNAIRARLRRASR